jgi:hypothetical protein
VKQTIHEQAGRLWRQYLTEELNRTAEVYEDMMPRQELRDFLPLIAYAWLD